MAFCRCGDLVLFSSKLHTEVNNNVYFVDILSGREALSVVLLTCALFSGQLMAGHKGHEFVWVKNVDHQLRHEADSDELRAVAEESAEGLREHFYWQKSRKPEAGQR
jgi:hypothetical protein